VNSRSFWTFFLVLCAGVACADGGAQPFPTGTSPQVDDDDHDGGPVPQPPQEHPLVAAGDELFEFDLVDGSPTFDCGGTLEPQLCDGEILDLIQEINGGPVEPSCIETMGQELVERTIEVHDNGAWTVEAITTAELATVVAEELALDLPDPSSDPSTVQVGPMEHRDGYTWIDLVLEHPTMGSWPMALLVPFGPSPYPGAVFLPGHPGLGPDGGQTSQLIDSYGTRNGRELARAGYVVLITSFRAYDSAQVESVANLAALCAGSSLAAIHARNAEISRQLLDATGLVESIAVVGHSGGSIPAVLTASFGLWEAVVFDLHTDWFLGVIATDDGLQVLSGVHPGLTPYAPCIYDGTGVEATGKTLPNWAPCSKSGAMAPHLGVPYVVSNSSTEEIIEFLDDVL
jgi:hypothetical protein